MADSVLKKIVFGTSPLSLLLRFALPAFALWTISRVVISQMNLDRVNAVEALAAVFAIGLRVDLISLGWALALPILLLPLCAASWGTRLWASFSRIWLGVFLTLVLVLEAASPAFLGEYEVRPNRLFLDYLGNPREVVPMLWGGFRVSFIVGLFALFGGGWLSLRWMRAGAAPQPMKIMTLVVLWPLLVVTCTLMIRSSLEHRPANPALFARWDDTLVNQIALNGSYTLGYAAYALRHETNVGDFYGRVPEAELLAALREDPRFADSPVQTPTLRMQTPSIQRERPPNLIIVIEESLGANFSKRLGGPADLTPELDRWAERGWWFEQLYATGTRSARGLEAIVAGFPPSPAVSVLKREKAQQGFATLASVLRDRGYHNEFIYGGESHFDNMRGFFLGNGFHAVTDQGDYDKPVFRGSWGVSDEDLFTKAQSRAEALHAEGKPFFSVVFTSSNHTPFEFPEGRIKVEGNPQTVENAVRYADYAVGQFLTRATQSAYFANTLIMVVADHDVRVYGDAVIPLTHFRIPGLLIGPGITPKKLNSLASQIDLAPTLLSVMGVQARIPFPGRDLTRSLPEFGVTNGPAPRAMMQFNDVYGHLEGEVLSVLLRGGESRRYRVDSTDRQLTALPPPDEAQRKRLLTEVLVPGWLYDNGGYVTGAP